MASVINTNILSINTHRQLSENQLQLASAIEKLSSGKRINSARDDAAGLAVSEGMTTQVRGLAVAKRNIADGISMAQTADGLLEEISTQLQRIRELAVQSASETLSVANRAHLHLESEQLTDEIDRVIHNARYNGTLLLDEAIVTGLNIGIQVGPNGGDVVNLNIPGLEIINSYGTLASGRGKIDLQSAASAVTSIGLLDEDIQTIVSGRAGLGATINRFESMVKNVDTYSENLQAARSRIVDTDFASATADLTRQQILTQAATAMLAQANQTPQGVVALLNQ